MRNGWVRIKLAELASQSKERVKVELGKEYPAVGVMMEGKGFVKRDAFLGGKTTYKQLTPIHPGQLVLRSITAWEAPIQIARYEHQGFHVSGVFPVFDLNADRLDPRYMALLCQYNPFWESMRERTVGTVLRRKTLSGRALLDIEISLPPLPEQKRIVDLISSTDAYIDSLEQQWDSAQRARNSMLRELMYAGGDGWIEVRLIDVCEIYQPRTIARSQMDDSAAFVVYGANGPVGHYSDFNHLNKEVVVTCRGATCGTVNMTPEKTWITGNAMVLSPKSDRLSKEFLFWALKTSVDLASIISGSAQPQITRERISPVKMLLPPIHRQRQIVELVSSLQEFIDSIEHSLTTARNLKSGLLSDLLSGKHEIPASYDNVMDAVR